MRTSLSPQAKTGSSQGGFTPLSRLTLGNHGGIRVRVRVSRIWVAFNPNTGTEFGLDCLLIDEEGVTIQARVLRHYMKRLEDQLVEGKVYALSNFTVGPRKNEYMACRNGLMIYIDGQTVVDEIDDNTGSSIPLHSFEFVDFDDVPLRNGDKRFFTDVIGQIVCIEGVGEAWKWKIWRNIPFRNIFLCDLRGRELNVALFGDLGRNFNAEQVSMQGRKAPIVAVFAGMLVRWYKGIGFTVCSTSASKYYLDLDIPQVHEFRARASLKGIDCTKGWFYWSCFHCKRSISRDEINSLCIQGCPKNPPPVPRHAFVIAAANGCFVVKHILNDDELQLIGAAQVAAGGGPLLSDEEGSSISYESSPAKIVKKEKMMDEEESEAGVCCELPQGGGSPASCSTSSPVKKEKMAIKEKEEREPKRQKIAKYNEAELTDAE
ncbi:hypothetical protein C2845_PM07G02000 [Panicum miliaceum]|uniref:Replication protein A 70 kDa DNA-binding subunit B/D first OB fold domain-containing protein n=1 Tax=Panicum miliaceum TaxID=4540 RepID=A0A3L6SML1_PANMI|nr:hypothetical protein C2845_PM07G02000 [Panicum miliaceum]